MALNSAGKGRGGLKGAYYTPLNSLYSRCPEQNFKKQKYYCAKSTILNQAKFYLEIDSSYTLNQYDGSSLTLLVETIACVDMFDTLNINGQYCDDTVFWRILNRILIILILVLTVVYIFFIFRTNINWDEFLYLSKIYDYKAGRPVAPTQSFYIHFFGWLTNIKGWEIEQIIAARLVQVIILFCCMGLLYSISCRFFSKTGALFTVFLAFSFTDIIRHGFSFRADPICLFFFLLSLFLLFKGGIISAIMAGLSLALSFLISIKTIFYIPTIVAMLIIAFYSSKDRKHVIKICLTFAFSSMCWILILYSLNSHMLANNLSELSSILIKGKAIIASAGSKVLWTGKFFPRSTNIFRSLLENPGTWFVVLLGTFVSIAHLFTSQYRSRYCFILTFVLPLCSLVFYRNAFSYYFVFIMPPALIISGVYIEIASHYEKQGSKSFVVIFILVPIFITTANAINLIGHQFEDQIHPQRELISLVHRLFPEPAPYIDRNRMIGSFPNAGFWMSTWGLEAYRQRGVPVMRLLIEKHQPQFLIANSPVLRINDEEWFGQNKSIYRLLDEDYIVLKENFVAHWGVLYVPGKRFKQLNQKREHVFEVLIEGQYTVEADGELMIDGRRVMPGEVVSLPKGQHRIETIGAHSVVLRWGDHLYRPEKTPSDKPIYTGL